MPLPWHSAERTERPLRPSAASSGVRLLPALTCGRRWPHRRAAHGRSVPAPPSCHHVPEEAQRLLRRLRLVGAFPFCLALLPGAFLPSAAPEEEAPRCCGMVPSALWQSPSCCPMPTTSRGSWEGLSPLLPVGMCSLSCCVPAKPLVNPVGASGLVMGVPRPLCLQEHPVALPRSFLLLLRTCCLLLFCLSSDACSRLWHLAACTVRSHLVRGRFLVPL